MNLDDLMEVWRSQAAAPLHGVNETLLRLALRQDEAKLLAERRRQRWITYVMSAGVVAGMAFVLALMIYAFQGGLATVWDFALPIVAGAAALLSVRAMYVTHRGQALREQGFGESLRDQINRRIAQLDDQTTRARLTSVLVTVLMGGICPMAILLVIWRINHKSVRDDGFLLVSLIVMCVWSVAISVWELRRQVQRDLVPRKRRLEAMLKELDAS